MSAWIRDINGYLLNLAFVETIELHSNREGQMILRAYLPLKPGEDSRENLVLTPWLSEDEAKREMERLELVLKVVNRLPADQWHALNDEP